MKRIIKVFLGESAAAIGLIRYDLQGSREHASFEYDSHWLASPDRFSLSPDLPLVRGPQFRKKEKDTSIFHSAIADTEPDGWARRVIMRDHVKKRTSDSENRSPLNQLDFLLAVDDQNRVGALRFQDEQGIFQRASVASRRTTPLLVELDHLLFASRAVENNSETLADLEYLRGRGTSLGGMRPKCSVVDSDGNLSVGKFPSITDERAVTKGEILALRLAADAGINAADGRLVYSDKIPVALIRRFDRKQPKGRIFYISAATLLGVEPNDPTPHTYTEIVDAIRIYGADVSSDLEELWRRIAFSILITNTDDHLLNHGFLHVEKDKWRLSPAFDINPFPERVRELKTWISPDLGPTASIESLLKVSSYFSISERRAKNILGEVEQAVSKWRLKGRALEMTEVELNQFESAFEHPERKVARQKSR